MTGIKIHDSAMTQAQHQAIIGTTPKKKCQVGAAAAEAAERGL